MTLFFEALLLIGFSLASFYIGYRYSIDFTAKPDQPYNPVEDIENRSHSQNKISQAQYQARQKELDRLYIQIKDAKNRDKKLQAEIGLLKNNNVLSDQEFNNLLDE